MKKRTLAGYRVPVLLTAGLLLAAFLLLGCGHKEEPSAKGYYEGPSTNKGDSGVKTGGNGSASDSGR